MMSTPTYPHRFRNKQQQLERAATRKLVCFTWNDEQFAIAIAQVQYVLHEFSVSGRLANGCGLVHHNHEIITLIDLSPLFLNRSAIAAGNYLIVCNFNHQKVGIAVNQIPAILEVSDDQFSRVPEAYQRSLNLQAIESLIQLSGRPAIFYLKPSILGEL